MDIHRLALDIIIVPVYSLGARRVNITRVIRKVHDRDTYRAFID